MFNLTTKFFLVASFLVLGGVSVASAQMADGSTLRVNVPNSFTVKDKTFEAGSYTIERTPSTIDSKSLLILRNDRGDGIIFDTIAATLGKAANDTELFFEGPAGNGFLSKIVFKGETAAIEIPKTKAQRELSARGTKVMRAELTQDTGF